MLRKNGGTQSESINIYRFSAIAIGKGYKTAAHSISPDQLSDLNRALCLPSSGRPILDAQTNTQK